MSNVICIHAMSLTRERKTLSVHNRQINVQREFLLSLSPLSMKLGSSGGKQGNVLFIYSTFDVNLRSEARPVSINLFLGLIVCFRKINKERVQVWRVAAIQISDALKMIMNFYSAAFDEMLMNDCLFSFQRLQCEN